MSLKFTLTFPDTDKTIKFESIDKLIDYIQNECDFENSDYIEEYVDDTNKPFVFGNLTVSPSTVVKMICPTAWSNTVSEVVKDEIDDLKYDLEHFRLKDENTFYCCGLEIRVLEAEE